MRIDGQRADLYSEALNRVGGLTPPTGNRAKAADAPGTGSADRVELSSDAQMLQAAMKAATPEATTAPSAASPAIRTDLVEKMRAALERGEIGDPGQLADALIDHLISR